MAIFFNSYVKLPEGIDLLPNQGFEDMGPGFETEYDTHVQDTGPTSAGSFEKIADAAGSKQLANLLPFARGKLWSPMKSMLVNNIQEWSFDENLQRHAEIARSAQQVPCWTLCVYIYIYIHCVCGLFILFCDYQIGAGFILSSSLLSSLLFSSVFFLWLLACINVCVFARFIVIIKFRYY